MRASPARSARPRSRAASPARRTDAAIVAYREWLTLHPSDAQSWRELARQESRAGRPRDAARALERAQALAPDAATAWRLALARAAAAPALTPLLSGSHDSDGNSTLRWGGAAEFPAAEGTAARLGVAATHERAANGATTAGLDELALRGASPPVAALTP